jgi:hypothetical protein
VIRAYLAAGALALSFGAGFLVNGWRLGSTIAKMKQLQAELIAQNHKTESMWSAHVIKLGEDANAEADRLRASLARANDAARSLHDASSSAATAAASAPGVSPAAGATILLLAELHRELDEFAGDAARAADEARAAGLQCERFDTLTR